MSGEGDAEHVVALALEPIGALVDRPHAVDHERRALVERRLEPKKAPIRQRAQMPHDLERLLGIAKLDRGDVGEIVVLLRRIVVQPAHDLASRRADARTRWCRPRSLPSARRSPGTSPRSRPRTDSARRPSAEDCAVLRAQLRRRLRCPGELGERNRHSPDRVCCTEFPNGSESSSMRLGGM